jgi:hypothetical protein
MWPSRQAVSDALRENNECEWRLSDQILCSVQEKSAARRWSKSKIPMMMQGICDNHTRQ